MMLRVSMMLESPWCSSLACLRSRFVRSGLINRLRLRHRRRLLLLEHVCEQPLPLLGLLPLDLRGLICDAVISLL